MSKKSEVEETVAALKEQAERVEAERLKLEKMAQEARKKAEVVIPKIKARVETIDAEIIKLQQERSRLLGQLKLLGLKVKGKGARGARAGGMGDKLKELMRGVGVGATITNRDIQEHLGSSSGYVGMLIKAQLEAGNLERTTPGTYKVTGLP